MKRLLAALGAAFFLTSCGPGSEDQAFSEPPQKETLAQDFASSLSPELQDRWERLRQEGSLKIGLNSRSIAFFGSEAKALESFNARLGGEVAELLGLKVEFTFMSLDEVFGQGGVIPPSVTDPGNPGYVPDAFVPGNARRIQVAAMNLTPLVWRHKLVRFVPVIPNQAIVVVQKKNSGMDLATARNLRFVVQEGTSYPALLAEFLGPDHRGPQPRLASLGDNVLALVNDGEAEATLTDSAEFFTATGRYPDTVPLGPVTSIHYLSWACDPADPGLAGLLQAAMSRLRAEGILGRLFQQSYGMDMGMYEGLLGLRAGSHIFDLAFTLEELEYLRSRDQRGGLSVAVIQTPETWRILDDGTILGFEYNMAQELARVLGMPVRTRLLGDINRFWTQDGVFNPAVIQDSSISYVPDLMKEVDAYLGPFGANEWRSRLVRFVPLHPAGLVLFGREADQIRTWADLDGKSLAAAQGSYQEELAKGIMEEHGVTITLVPYTTSPEEDPVFRMVLAGDADLAIDGSIFLAKGMQSLEELTVSPLPLARSMVSWAVAPDNAVLDGILKKFIDLSLANRSFHKYWEEAYGVPFDYYLSLVN